jgi:hypothetical protein
MGIGIRTHVFLLPKGLSDHNIEVEYFISRIYNKIQLIISNPLLPVIGRFLDY